MGVSGLSSSMNLNLSDVYITNKVYKEVNCEAEKVYTNSSVLNGFKSESILIDSHVKILQQKKRVTAWYPKKVLISCSNSLFIDSSM